MSVTVTTSEFYAIDSAKAMEELGRIFTTIFKDSIVLTIGWYLSEKGQKWIKECTFGGYLN